MNIGIIGNGFVGNAIYQTFSPQFKVRVYDTDTSRATNSLEEVIFDSEVIFVCVPTPMKTNGKIDLSMIDGVFNNVIATIKKLKISDIEMGLKVFVIKSTVVPGTTDDIASRTGLNVIFSPEFLTERTAVTDSICSNHAIVGGADYGGDIVDLLYKSRFGRGFNVFRTTARTAEFAKYMRNCFFATKVTFMNEMFRIAINSEIDWEDAVAGFALDGRIGHSHLDVPGHDGMYGYGGTCFPKDLNALVQLAQDTDFDPVLLMAVSYANSVYRGVEDWKDKVGRAVSLSE